MELLIFPNIKEKLLRKSPPVTPMEVEEAFFLFDGRMLLDTRERHHTLPPTQWFLSETVDGRILKLVIIVFAEEDKAVLKTAYDPSIEEIDEYESRT